MSTNEIPVNSLLGKQILFLDGGMGTQLQAKGLQPGEAPETWNLTRPDDIRAVHESYLAAGADIIYANTFGANKAKIHGDIPLADVIDSAISIARKATEAVGGKRFVALDVGPTGRLLKPAGDFEFDAAYDAFAEQISIGAKAGADVVAIETMGDTYELKAAVLAAKENCDLPVFVSNAYGEDGKLMTGADPEAMVALLEGMHADAIGEVLVLLCLRFSEKKRVTKSNSFWRIPSVKRKRRNSGWKITTAQKNAAAENRRMM